MVVRSVATCIPAIPNTSKRIVILSAAVAGAAVSANIAARRQRRDRCGKRHRSGIFDTSQPRRGGPARQPGRRLDRVRGALLNARAGYGTGRVAQRESTPFTRVGSQVQSLSRPPPKAQHVGGFRGSTVENPRDTRTDPKHEESACRNATPSEVAEKPTKIVAAIFLGKFKGTAAQQLEREV